MDPDLPLEMLVCVGPSLTYWACYALLLLLAPGLLEKRQRALPGEPSKARMLACQLAVDTLQTALSAVGMWGLGGAEKVYTLRAGRVLAGLVVIDVVEYVCHRAYHEIPALHRFHRTHHAVRELHPLATFYNHPVEVVLTGAALALGTLGAGMSPSEVSLCSCIGVACTFRDHTPGIASDRHIRHHRRGKLDYAQPFSGLLDWVGGTVGGGEGVKAQ